MGETYNLLINPPVLFGVLPCCTSPLLLRGIETLVEVVLALALALLGAGRRSVIACGSLRGIFRDIVHDRGLSGLGVMVYVGPA